MVRSRNFIGGKVEKRIYLDNCCYYRPFDDQKQIAVYLETQAKLHIQKLIKEGKLGISEVSNV